MTSKASKITVASVSTAHWDLITDLFATSSGVRECWCMWPRRPRGMHSADRIANAAAMKELLDSGQSPGLIAVAEGRALGWCAAGPRATYPQYTPTTDPSVRWAVPCLYVRQTADNRSVARALIAAAVALACENGAVTVDGPPPYWLPGDTDAVAAATRAFLENGFENVGPGARMPELRHRLHVLPDR